MLNLFEAIGLFLLVFFGSMLIGIVTGIATALGLKYTLVRRMPKIESCLIVLIAYASYFFSNGVRLSGRWPFLLLALYTNTDLGSFQALCLSYFVESR